MRLSFRVLFATVCAFALHAQEVSPQLFNALQWRSIGPFRGGRAVAVSGVPGGGNTFYFGGVDGGIWKTNDAGTVWTPIFNGQPVASIGALAVAPSDPNTIYAGTGESDIRSDLASGDGLYKSTDGGNTWENVGLKDTRQISRIVVDPRDPRIVLVAALGHAYGPNPERGIFRSSNGGETWEKVLYRGPDVGAADLAIAAHQPKVVFAAMWNAHRPPWSTYGPIEGPGSGLFRSHDGGNTWTQLTGQGLPEGQWGRVGVAVSADGKRVYATIDVAASKASGLYRSDDGGESWTCVNQDSRITSRAWYFSSITIDPNDPDVLYVPNVAFYKLSDGGKQLSIIRGAPGGDDYHQVWVDPADSRHMVLGVDQGTTVTLDGGATWSSWYNQPTAQFYHVVTDSDFLYHVYGAQQDSGTAATASRTDHEEIDARDFFTVGGSESGYIAPDPKNPDIFYISGTYGTLVRFNRKLMQSQNIAPSADTQIFEQPISERKFRDPWTPVLVFSPAQPNALYFGTQYVMRTLDGGSHWQTISPDLTGGSKTSLASKEQPTLDNAEERGYGVVYTIAPSPLIAAEIWAGTDTGSIHLTRDSGKTWTNVTPTGLSAWSKITLIEASHFNPAEAYAAVDRHRLDDQRPYLFRTRDYGKSWQPISAGIADRAFVRCIREDPRQKGLLFAGTEFGVYVSFDDGDHWQSLQANLPVTSVPDLVVHGDDLVAATHGRSFWILDDIAPLRELAGHATNPSSAILFKPAIAYRMKHDLFLGTPVPPEEPQAPNPATGAYIDYYLPQPATDEVMLDILDGNGQLVRHYSSTGKPLAPPKDVPIAPRWLPRPEMLSGASGMHRWIWDLRYARKGEIVTDDVEGTGLATGIGPQALPGLYKAQLTVDGHSFTQSFQLKMDPRSSATESDLNAQFQWSRRAFNELVSAGIAVSELRGVSRQLSDLKSQPAASSALVEADELLNGVKPNGEGLQTVTASIRSALNAMESGDRAPTSQAVALYQSSAKSLSALLSKWENFKRSTLPALNLQLSAAGAATVKVMRDQAGQ